VTKQEPTNASGRGRLWESIDNQYNRHRQLTDKKRMPYTHDKPVSQWTTWYSNHPPFSAYNSDTTNLLTVSMNTSTRTFLTVSQFYKRLGHKG